MLGTSTCLLCLFFSALTFYIRFVFSLRKVRFDHMYIYKYLYAQYYIQYVIIFFFSFFFLRNIFIVTNTGQFETPSIHFVQQSVQTNVGWTVGDLLLVFFHQ